MGAVTPIKRWLSGFAFWAAGDFLAVAFGGTGATTQADARTNLGAAASGANADITSLSALARVAGPLDISTNAGALPAAPAATVLRVSGPDGISARLVLDSFGPPGNFVFRAAAGTAAAPSAVQSGASLGQFTAFGYGATGYSTSSRAGLFFRTAQAWTDTAQGTRISFVTTPLNGMGGVEVFALEANGSAMPGADAAQSIGSSALRWSNLYLVNNPTVSSDAGLKTPRASSAGGPMLSAAELAAWAKVSPSVWTLNSDTTGLLHVGYIAQAVQAAFAAQGLDVAKYALWHQDTMPDGSTRAALIYAECAVFEAAYQRQQATLLSKQVAVLAKALGLILPTA